MEIENKLILMRDYNLTIEEEFILELLFLASEEENHSEYLIEYYNYRKDPSLRDVLLSLQEKKIIKKSYKIPPVGSTFDITQIDFNENFINNYMKFSGILGQEFLKAYPHRLLVNGMSFDIGNFAKKFNSEQEFYYAYGKAIGWNRKKHQEVLDIIKWAKTQPNLINGNICDFVISKAWTRLAEVRDGDDTTLSVDFIESV